MPALSAGDIAPIPAPPRSEVFARVALPAAPAQPADTTPPSVAAPKPPVSDIPESTTATYGDWTLRCIAQPGRNRSGDNHPVAPATSRCEIDQTIILKGQTTPVARIAIGIDPESKTQRLVAQLPEGSWLSAQPLLSVGQNSQPISLTYRRCLRGTCLADAIFTNEMISAAATATKPGLVSFQMIAGKDIRLPVSMNGFAAAEVAFQHH